MSAPILGQNAAAETQMHPPKHILLFYLARGFEITQSGVPKATVGRYLSIIHPLVHPKTQQLRQAQTAVPLSEVQFQSVFVLSRSLITVFSSSLEQNYNWRTIRNNHHSLTDLTVNQR